ncbi:zinc finger protein 2 isoform X2 [Teleopsis dalmanni]|uniref:zinc finger protein 2 isoform X2 n=1 Tax=Teleopsis dalmanni TaxID=139649 RepID=UPI0018CC9249|nr:zinc finger protein 2 isoform X2 [Teleopsis dalmanni]
MSTTDVKTFTGKIVYNLEGNAFIIDADNATLSKFTDLQTASVGLNYNVAASIGTDVTNGLELDKDKTDTNSNPKIHTFRVISAEDVTVDLKEENIIKIQKPILMCFICKLSFGNAKSFGLHANAEHTLDLQETEKRLLKREYSSAIIQRDTDEKPQISFLEPLDAQLMPKHLTYTEMEETAATKILTSTTSIPTDTPTSEDITINPIDIKCHTSNCVSISSESQHIDVNISSITSSNSNNRESACSPNTLPVQIDLSQEQNNIFLSKNQALSPSHLVLSASLESPPSTFLGAIPISVSSAEPISCCLPSKSVNSALVSSKESSNSPTQDVNICTTKNFKLANTLFLNLKSVQEEKEKESNKIASSTDSLSSNNKANQNKSFDLNTTVSNSPVELKASKYQNYDCQESKSYDDQTPISSSSTFAEFINNQSHQQRKEDDNALLSTNTENVNTELDLLQLQHQYQFPFQSVSTSASATRSVEQQHSHLSTFHASLAALANESNNSSVKLISELLQQQFAAQQQKQQQPKIASVCPEHMDFKGIDCKTCELLEIHHAHIKTSVTPHRSPSDPNTTTNLPISPTTCATAAANVSANLANNSNNAAPSASSFTIGACSEHINGRPLGVDCARCELILNSARLNSGSQMSTRNSCKTLKCPQCNWHYKYQETLEIHMREKHPDGESACGYCLAGQQHPRLARGESYSCGYKPYRCEICNYSTTTKGNLSIHMQSDKHLNNMQELNNSQSMVAAAAAAAAVAAVGSSKIEGPPKSLIISNTSQSHQKTQQQQQQQQQQQSQQLQTTVNNVAHTLSTNSTSTSSSVGNKTKPAFRCDICNYETSVARNLRIHMTSEKHTHNMAVLQNNIKHIQALNFLQQRHQQATAVVAAASAQQHQQISNNLANIPVTFPSNNNFLPEVALADLAYNQALMIQLLQHNSASSTQQQQIKSHIKTSTPSPTSSSGQQQTQMQPQCSPNAKSPSLLFSDTQSIDFCLSSTAAASGEISDAIEPPIKPDPCPSTLYSCIVCANFNSNSLDELNQHLLIDRSRQYAIGSGSAVSNSTDIMLILNNNYICRLCNYKTNLKANFQLHSKTDKHLQKLNFVNHIREGGPQNEYKLKYHQQISAVQLKCNCCDFYTNSIQKLSLHTQHMRHDTMRMIFQHLLALIQQNNDAEHKSLTTTENSNNATDNTNNTNVGTFTEPVCLPENSFQLKNSKKALLCQLCIFTSQNILDMVQHIKSLRHLQIEQFICLQRRSEQLETPSIQEVFKICDYPVEDSFKSEQITPESNLTNAIVHHNRYINEDSNNEHETRDITDNNRSSPTSTNSSIISCNNSAIKKARSVTTGSDMNDNISDSNLTHIPTVIFKCSNCNHFAQNKEDMESHIDLQHPNFDQEYESIPTNAAAVHAFQAAVAAATAAAAVASAASTIKEVMPKLKNDGEDDCPIEIKRERLEISKDKQQSETNRMETLAIDQTVEDDDINANLQKQLQELHKQSKLQESKTGSIQRESFDEISSVQCPLCQESFSKQSNFELHLMHIHSVNRDGLARLLKLVDTSIWQQLSKNSATLTAADNATEIKSPKVEHSSTSTIEYHDSRKTLINTGNETVSNDFYCSQCDSSFKQEQQLLQHAQKLQHYNIQQGSYLCLAANNNSRPCQLLFNSPLTMISHYNDVHMSSVISERHVYKYRCKQCSLAFKTQEKLTTHTLYHTMRDATKCALCHRNFRSTQALQKHMEQLHPHEVESSVGIEDNSSQIQNSLSNELCISLLQKQKHETSTDNVVKSNETGESVNVSTISSSPDVSLVSSEQHLIKESKTTAQQLSNIYVQPTTPELIKQQDQQKPNSATALFKQQHNESEQSSFSTGDILQQLQMQPSALTQKYEQQTQQGMSAQMSTTQNLQSIQNIQQLQHQLPQIAAAATASGLPFNPIDMLNFMQFHHLMSLNFMNLAPPLIYDSSCTTTGNTANPNSTVPINNNPSVTNAATSQTAMTTTSPTVDVGSHLLQQQNSPVSMTQLSNNQKRARTRITDDQLKILRAHFDINNSPSEESIMEMSQKANLPMKVVKHWFRNTLFKERQRNKDSPYNFNNPPSTTLNIEEYERTGQAKVTPLTEGSVSLLSTSTDPSTNMIAACDLSTNASNQIATTTEHSLHENSESNMCDFLIEHLKFDQNHQQELKQSQSDGFRGLNTSSVSNEIIPLEVQIKTEPSDEVENYKDLKYKQPQHIQQPQLLTTTSAIFLKQHQQHVSNVNENHEEQEFGSQTAPSNIMVQQQQHTYYNNFETKSESGSSDIHSRPQSPNNASTANPYSNMNDLLSQQLDNSPLNNMSNIGNLSKMGPPKKFQINKTFDKSSPSSQQFDNNSNSSNSSSTSSGKRANRTRFTDYQIKVLQEFFENNSYPKDSDLEYLSKLLLLSPRVIVVWFQNARQKQRKIYENQPNNSLYETEEKKQNINYACKKCNLVFQRYYELIRHQKNHCFKEENNKKSAKAQIAAAQIAQNLSSEDSNSSLDVNNSNAAAAAAQHVAALAAAAVLSNSGGSTSCNSPAGVGLGSLLSSSPQHLFNKTSTSATDFSPSTTPTPPHNNSLDHQTQNTLQQLQSKQKFECDKCKLNFNKYENFREHQLIHIMNPNLFLHQHQNSTDSLTPYPSFGSILHSLQQAAATATSHHHPQTKKRKLSETSSNPDDLSSVSCTSVSGDYDVQHDSKRYDFLFQYFIQNQTNPELKQQFLLQQQQSQDSSEFEVDFLFNFYQQTELKKRSNFDFLYQYFLKNEKNQTDNQEQPDRWISDKPSIDFLLQYYQINESKKFFQLDASPQQVNDDLHHQKEINAPSIHAQQDSPSNGKDESSDVELDFAKVEDEELPYFKNKNNNKENFGCEGMDFTNKNDDLVHEQHAMSNNFEINRSITTENKKSPLVQAFYHNLEDFLDATMIENTTQSLTFNDSANSNNKTEKGDVVKQTIPLEKILPPEESYLKISSATSSTVSVTATSEKQNKRLRTTILPEQLNFLYECYQNESNPSRKMLEEISKKVNLKKRVVQVWFQNSRAKDKKSRNQRYFAASDDSNYEDATSNANISVSNNAATNTGSTITTKVEIRDCKLCELPEVNTQQHAFTVEHIRRVKELLKQTLIADDLSDSNETHKQPLLNNIYIDSFDDKEGIGNINDNSVHEENAPQVKRKKIKNNFKENAENHLDKITLIDKYGSENSTGNQFENIVAEGTKFLLNNSINKESTNAPQQNLNKNNQIKLVKHLGKVDQSFLSEDKLVHNFKGSKSVNNFNAANIDDDKDPTGSSKISYTADILQQLFNHNKIPVIGGK